MVHEAYLLYGIILYTEVKISPGGDIKYLTPSSLTATGKLSGRKRSISMYVSNCKAGLLVETYIPLVVVFVLLYHSVHHTYNVTPRTWNLVSRALLKQIDFLGFHLPWRQNTNKSNLNLVYLVNKGRWPNIHSIWHKI